MDKIIIWGATGQAIVIEELLSHFNVEVEAFFENDCSVKSPIQSVPIYYEQKGFMQWLSSVDTNSDYYYVTAIGGNNGSIRQRIGEMLETHGLKPFTAIHPTAFVAGNAVIGKGVQILANSSICAKVHLGEFVIINTAANVDHECLIGNNVHIGPGASLAGCIEVEDNVFIGTNATILPRLKIGKGAIVGAGAVVTKNVPVGAIVFGNPAKSI